MLELWASAVLKPGFETLRCSVLDPPGANQDGPRSVAGRHGYESIFIRFNSFSESFDLTKLMTHNDFTGLDSNQLTTQNEFLKVDSKRFTTKKLPEF